MKSRRFKVVMYLDVPFTKHRHWTEWQMEEHVASIVRGDKELCVVDVDVEAHKEPVTDIHLERPELEDICSFATPVGYIAPDGKFYGMESNDCGLCHIAIANELFEYYKDKIDLSKGSSFSADGKLEHAGFIKVRANTIYYSIFPSPPIYWTDAQCATVLRYMKHLEEEHDTCVSFYGYGKIRSYDFVQMDKFAILKKFDRF